MFLWKNILHPNFDRFDSQSKFDVQNSQWLISVSRINIKYCSCYWMLKLAEICWFIIFFDFSHKLWRQILKKERRRRIRQKKAHEVHLKQEQGERETFHLVPSAYNLHALNYPQNAGPENTHSFILLHVIECN